LSSKTIAFKTQLAKSAFEYQDARAEIEQKQSIETVFKKSNKTVHHDFSQLAGQKEHLRSVVATQGNKLTEPEKRALVANIDTELTKSAFNGVLNRDPMAALDLLETEEVKDALGDEHGKYKDAVLAKISVMGETAKQAQVIEIIKKNDDFFNKAKNGEISLEDINSMGEGHSTAVKSLLMKYAGLDATVKKATTLSEDESEDTDF
jgi:hypothetical protein